MLNIILVSKVLLNASYVYHCQVEKIFTNRDVGGRPSVDMTPYREEISELYKHGLTVAQVQEHLQLWYNASFSYRTIERRLQEWDV